MKQNEKIVTRSNEARTKLTEQEKLARTLRYVLIAVAIIIGIYLISPIIGFAIGYFFN